MEVVKEVGIVSVVTELDTNQPQAQKRGKIANVARGQQSVLGVVGAATFNYYNRLFTPCMID